MIGHRLRQPSRSYIVGASISSDALKGEVRLSMHAMRAVSIIAVLLVLVANALELLPVASPFEPYLSGGALVLGLIALVTILAGRGPQRDTRAAAEAARPLPIPTGANSDAEVDTNAETSVHGGGCPGCADPRFLARRGQGFSRWLFQFHLRRSD